jgi:hypothetical protein
MYWLLPSSTTPQTAGSNASDTTATSRSASAECHMTQIESEQNPFQGARKDREDCRGQYKVSELAAKP